MPTRTTLDLANNEKSSYDVDLAFLCAIELASTLILKFPKLIDNLNRHNIKVTISILREQFIYGYIGTSFSSVCQYIYCKKIKIVEDYLVSV